MEVQGKKDQENGPKAEKDKTEKATGKGRRKRESIEKWDKTGSPKISDRGETSEIPQPPFGAPLIFMNFNCYCKARCVRTSCASYRAI